MIEICPPGKCSGCSACSSVCPVGAIAMQPDDEGFVHPVVDRLGCVGCGRCKTFCPQQNKPVAKNPLKVYAVKARDEDVRLASSSGGVFSLLAADVLSDGGVVFGAAFCGDEWEVRHVCIESAAELGKLRGSKYVQSRIEGAFGMVKDFLSVGRRVAFCGTPCQIVGLKRYLSSVSNVDMVLLLTIEVICHGVPSPLAWSKYLWRRRDDFDDFKIGEISFRSKSRGWKRFSMSVDFGAGGKYDTAFQEDVFMRGFLAELYNRQSCHDCVCRGLHSEADVILGDFWGIERWNDAFDDDKGVSAVLLMSATGMSCFERIAAKCNVWESSTEDVVAGNSALVRNPVPHEKRNDFFSRSEDSDFDELVDELLKPSFARRLRGFASRHLGWFKI